MNLLRYCLSLLLLLAVFWALPTEAQNRDEQETRNVNGCEYQVVPGLAEITSITKVKDKSETALNYDHYEVRFKFIPMEGDVILPTVPAANMMVVLNEGQHEIPVGPQYISRYSLRTGNKYAMTLLQTPSARCSEQFFYESPAMPNDIAEASPNLQAFLQQKLADAYQKGEQNAQNAATTPLQAKPAKETAPNKEKLSRRELRELEKANEEAEKGRQDSLAQVDANKKAEAERIRAEEEAKKAAQQATPSPAPKENSPSEGNTLLSEEERESIRAQIRAELEAKQAADSIRQAEKLKKEREAREAERMRLLKLQREADLKRRQDSIAQAQELKQQLIQEERERIRQEELARAKKEEEERLRQQRLQRAREEMELDALKRATCEYSPKISGIITIERAEKVRSAEESPLGYDEQQLLVSFKPDNFGELSRKEKKFWKEEFRFVLDPMGMSANPSNRYLREYRVYKGASFRGFARNLNSGICTPVYFESPDLPTDKDEIRGEDEETND